VNIVGGITVNEAGRKGGLAILAKHGSKHFAEIGKKGQQEMKKRYPGMASEWGKKGGRPRKNNL
jgi:general stress protein YciG